MVLVAGDVTDRATPYFADRVREAIPDGFALAVLIPPAFHLIGSCGHTPQETVWKLGTGDL